MMKSNSIKKLMVIMPLLLVLVVISTMCKKEPIPSSVTLAIIDEEIQVGEVDLKISGVVEYPGKIFKVNLMLGLDTLEMNRHEAQLEDKSFSVTVNSLKPNTSYYYRYAIDLGMSKDFLTRAKLIKTEEQLPDSVTIIKVITGQVSDVSYTSASCRGEVTIIGNDSIVERGICWGMNHNPSIVDSCLSAGSGEGSFSVQLTGLSYSSSYHVRAYAKSVDTLVYGEDVSFQTLALGDSDEPVVITKNATGITLTSVVLGGEVLVEGETPVSSRGICWSVAHNPDPSSGNNVKLCGSGQGEFVAEVTGLLSNTRYYVRAFATNNGFTGFGEEISFVTLSQIATKDIIEITQTTAICGGIVSEDGGVEIIERGVCWDTLSNPNIEGKHLSNGTGYGEYTIEMTGLLPNTEYYVRAYSNNGRGVSYGEEKSFRTKENPPIVTTNWPSWWLNSATLKGTVAVNDGSTITDRGFRWGTSPDPIHYITGGSQVACDAGLGDFETHLAGLTENTVYYFVAYAKNSDNIAYGNVRSFTTYERPMVTTGEVTVLSDCEAIGSGDVTNEGSHSVEERGLCWGLGHNPDTTCDHVSAGVGSGAFSAHMTNLAPNTVYYVRAYAISHVGLRYGEPKSFTTQGPPTVRTLSASDVLSHSAIGHGIVINDGGVPIISCGVCWSTHEDPDLDDNWVAGTGNPFSAEITGLEEHTKYYVRAFATNQYGTAYGDNAIIITVEGYLCFAFSTGSDENQKVFFSKGNLQYKASNHTWRFAENQWDYVGNDTNGNVYEDGVKCNNSLISSSYSGWIDLFGWGTSGYNHNDACYQPWSTSISNQDYNAYGSPIKDLFDDSGKADWGYNAISNGGNMENSGCRTLTNEEWDWVLLRRPGKRFAKANVNGVNGIILLPDDWVASNYELHRINEVNANFNSNIISVIDWTNTLEIHGAVFLPLAGSRNGTIMNAGYYSYYWSSSHASSESSYLLMFNDDVLQSSSTGSRFYGFSVRLVFPASVGQ